MLNPNLAMCGLDCSKCEAFIATQNDDDALREKVAKDWSAKFKQKQHNRPPLKKEDINCQGCLSKGPIYLYCQECKIRLCGLVRGIQNCKECDEYKCENLIKKQSHFW